MSEPTAPKLTTSHRAKSEGCGEPRRGTPFGVWAALAAAAAIRLTWLSRWPLWVDELATLQRLGLSFAEHLRAMRGNHPLYEILLRLWASPGSGDAWLRLPSAALGVLTVYLTWRLLLRLGRREAAIGAWLMALSPLHLMYSRMARSYSLAVALALLSHLALLGALRKRKAWLYVAYAVTTALMVYANLLTCAVWAGQVFFLVWFFRRHWRRLKPWILTQAAAAALVLPWMGYSFVGAVTWGSDTQYTARQYGRAAKAAYQALTLCVGETVHPLNPWIVPFAAAGFGCALAWGALRALRRRGGMPCYLFTQVVVVYASGLAFAAAAAKHLAAVLPAWLGLVALALVRIRSRAWRVALGMVVFGAMIASNVNYFLGCEFADADMVTPWCEIVETVERAEKPGDALLIGYRMDAGARDMFARYYTGGLTPEHIDFDRWREQISEAEKTRSQVFLLLHDGDPWLEVEDWLRDRGRDVEMKPFQNEEHTLERIRESGLFGSGEAYYSPLYRLYRCRPTPGGRESGH